MLQRGYEPIDHTADVGLRVWGQDRPELFLNAARGMLSLCLDADTVRRGAERHVTFDGEDDVELLFEWLREILYQLNVSRLVWYPQRVDGLTAKRLEAVVNDEPFDPSHHRLLREIKAVTYHGLVVEPGEDGWTAEVIFDV